MEKKIIDLYGDYMGGFLNRREFITRLAIVAGGTSAAYSLMIALGNDYAKAEMISKNDNRVESSYVNLKGASGDIRADLVLPKGDKKVPGVLVIHEIWGLNPHIEDVARRFAVEGFMALAPDALSALGGTPDDPQKAFNMVRQLDNEKTVKDYIAAAKYLQNHPRSNGNVGVVGFCWGGSMTNQVAVNWPDLKAAVPFYGGQPDPGDVPRIKAAMMLHYAGNDQRINQGIPAFEDALKKASIDYKLYIYDGTEHAFHNDTNESRYNREAAQLAWKRTIEFFRAELSP
jgi:carboxymethylenebutenolidase